jgi:hypothetical protein
MRTLACFVRADWADWADNHSDISDFRVPRWTSHFVATSFLAEIGKDTHTEENSTIKCIPAQQHAVFDLRFTITASDAIWREPYSPFFQNFYLFKKVSENNK